MTSLTFQKIVRHIFETLMIGDSIQEIVSEVLTYDTLTADDKNLWSLLFLEGIDEFETVVCYGIALRIPVLFYRDN